MTTLDPRHTALLVMDYQVGILARLADPGALLERMERVIADVRSNGGTIGYVRVAFEDADYAAVPAANKVFSAAAEHRAMGNEDPATAIHERLAPEPGDIVVRKTRVGAMSTTDLDRQLRDRGITTLVLAGISTSGVVLATVVDAADRDYRLYVLSDGVEDPDAEVHDVLMRTFFPKRADVIDSTALRALLKA
jgi:nicotinamidase-related amidase